MRPGIATALFALAFAGIGIAAAICRARAPEFYAVSVAEVDMQRHKARTYFERGETPAVIARGRAFDGQRAFIQVFDASGVLIEETTPQRISPGKFACWGLLIENSGRYRVRLSVDNFAGQPEIVVNVIR